MLKLTDLKTRTFVRKERKVTRNVVADVCDYCDLMVTSQMVNVMNQLGCTNAMAQHSTGRVSIHDIECYYGTMKKGVEIPIFFYGGALQQRETTSNFEMVDGTVADWVADTILYQMSQDIAEAWELFKWCGAH